MNKKYIKLIIVLEILGVLLQGKAFYEAFSSDTISVERPTEVGAEEDIKLSVEGLGQKEDIDLSVLAIKPTEEEVERIFEKAKAEIDEGFFGENTTADAVWKKVDPKTGYVGDLVEAEWDYSPRGIVDAAGNIDYDKYGESEIITAMCTMEACGKKNEYSFPFVVVQPDVGTPEGFLYTVKKELVKSNEKNDEGELILPGDLSGEKLHWHKPVEYTGILICIMGIVTGMALYLGAGADERKEVEKRREEFGRQYPDIVENLGLYVGAGISVRAAFEKMESQYLRWKEKHPGLRKESYENLVLMNRALHDGKLESEAYEWYGRVCIHPAYRKLSVLLQQNIKRGNDKLLEQLSHEEQMVTEAKRRQIKSAGEMISTKLLLPMGGLLMMILIVLIVPALQFISL